jgi:chemotaxis protein CheC
MAFGGLQTLTDIQRDALREVANIGAGHAATALSLMTGTKIMVSVPALTVTHVTALTPALLTANNAVTVISMDMRGRMDGQVILVLPRSAARKLAMLVLRRDLSTEMALDVLETSALLEVGNVLAGAYMTALSEFLQMRLLLLSPPSLIVGAARQMLWETAQRAAHTPGYAFCVETHFILEMDERLLVYFLLLPDAESVDAMLAAIHMETRRSP